MSLPVVSVPKIIALIGAEKGGFLTRVKREFFGDSVPRINKELRCIRKAPIRGLEQGVFPARHGVRDA